MSRRSSKLTQLFVACLLALSLLPIGAVVTSAATTGSLYVYKKNGDGARLLNSCFQLYKKVGSSGRGDWVAGLCDASNGEPNDGKLVFSKLPPGSYVLQESYAPVGYQFAVDRVVTIVAGERTQAVVKDPRGGTTLVISKTNPAGTLLIGACFSVNVDLGGSNNVGQWVTGLCDSDDGTNDGKTSLRGLRMGNYVLVEYLAPTGYKIAANKTFKVTSSSGTIRLTVVDEPFVANQAVTINKVDPNGVPVVGACFQLSYQHSNPDAPNGVDVGGYAGHFSCDYSDGAGDGKTVFNGVAAGSYVALETTVPAGFQVAPIKPFTKVSGAAKTLTIVDKIGGTTLKLLLRDQQGNTLYNACFSVHREVEGRIGVFISAHCDQADGAVDGVVTFSGMPNGRFTASEYQSPTGYVTPQLFFTLASNSTKTITVKHSPSNQSQGASVDESKTPTSTPVPTEIATETATPEPTVVPTETATPEPTLEPTEIVTASPTPEATAEVTATPTPEGEEENGGTTGETEPTVEGS